MTLTQFHVLSPRAQLLVVLTQGTYLAHHREQERGLVKLYYVPNEGRGIFVEVHHNERKGEIVVIRSFSNSARLADYAQGVQLPGE